MTWDGVLVIDKPAGPTSHDVVQRVRRLLGVKAGHTGTLDPAASGVLPLVLGRASRLSRFLAAGEKEYLAWIRLGLRTDSFDMEGRVLERRQVPELDARELEEVLQCFRGEILQVPPMFSAVKVGGRRLYEAARRGETVERVPRQVTVHALVLLEREPERLQLRVRCSAGTYLRTLADDLGTRLGCGAVLESLRRIRSGGFTLEQAVPLDQLEERAAEALIPLDALLPELPPLEVDSVLAKRVVHGNAVPAPDPDLEQPGWLRIIHRGRLLALGRASGGWVRPELVLATPGN
ncbi:MAG: tRNA pseudouridine(55) synthase TruB [Acidobacteriota bacterium]